jgi:enediyne biosynthesis protein E4
LLAGNYYENNVQIGRYDGDFGSLLINLGQGNFSVQSLNGMVIKGQSRHVRKISIGGQDAFIIARNNDSARVISFGPRAIR